MEYYFLSHYIQILPPFPYRRCVRSWGVHRPHGNAFLWQGFNRAYTTTNGRICSSVLECSNDSPRSVLYQNRLQNLFVRYHAHGIPTRGIQTGLCGLVVAKPGFPRSSSPWPAPGLPLSFKGQFFGEPNSGRASSDQGYNPNPLRLKVRET